MADKSIPREQSDRPGRPAPRIHLRIMATTDVHMHLLPFDYETGRTTAAHGLARTLTLIRASRAEVDNALLFDNGDFLFGNPMSDAILRNMMRGRREVRGFHPIVRTMARVGVDALNLGNHDFDQGLEFLGQVLDGAPFPVIASNLTLRPVPGAESAPRPAILPFALLERQLRDTEGNSHSLKIGVAGFLPPDSIAGLYRGPFRPEYQDIVERARFLVPQLRALGADVVVVLAHSGIGSGIHIPMMENAILPLARIEGIDALVGGHTHQLFPDAARPWPEGVDAAQGLIHGTPTVLPGFWGSHLGEIDLTLAPRPGGGWHVETGRARARPALQHDADTTQVVPAAMPDRKFARYLRRLHDAMIARSQEVVGETRVRLHSYFSAIGPSMALDVVHRAKLDWARRALEDTPLEGLPLVATASPFKAGGIAGPEHFTDIAPGPITWLALSSLYNHLNELCIVRMTGAELADWLERAASLYQRIEPFGGDQPLFAPMTPLYRFKALAGCSYEFDLSAPARYTVAGQLSDPAATRVRRLEVDGVPLEPNDSVLVVTTVFRAAGGGGYRRVRPGAVAYRGRETAREVLAEHLGARGPVEGPPLAAWRLAPVAGAAATFLSSPRAAETLPVEGFELSAGEPTEDGFRRYRLALDKEVSYMAEREVGAGERLANPVRSGRKQP